MNDKQDILLQVEGLTTVFGTGKKQNRAVDGVSFSVRRGEVFGLVGESGSGKTTTGRTIIGLYPAAAGNVFLDGRLLCAGGRKPRRADRHFTSDNIQMIFQDPIASLNPRMTVREIIAEGLVIRGMKDKKEIDRRVYEALDMVGLLPEHAGRYPHEFSGGQRQRIGIARALILRPKLIIADEPVSALDVSIQAQVISLMNELRQTFGLTILFIAHDLSVVKYFCDRIAVMYRGKIVELAGDDELFHRPMHPYTQSLLSAIPLPDPRYEKTRKRIVYTPVPAPEGEAMPQLREVLPQHFVSCTETELAALQAAAKTAPKGGSL